MSPNGADAAIALKDAFALADDPVASPVEVEWLDALLPSSPGPVLDASCGIGRMLVPLVERGRGVHGCDESASALTACAQRLGPRAGDVPLLRQQPADFNAPFRYVAAYFSAGTFELIADPLAALSALARIANHLVDPGVLVLDLWVPAEALHPPGAALVEVRTVAGAGGTTIVARSETLVDVDGRQLTRRTRYEQRSGATIEARQDDRARRTWYTADEAVAMARDCGFIDMREVASPRPTGDGRRYALVAARVNR